MAVDTFIAFAASYDTLGAAEAGYQRAGEPAATNQAGERMAMDIGPVELIVLTFPGERADRAVAEALAEVVSREYATVLDVVFLTRTADGLIRILDADENLDEIGLG